MDCGDQFRDSMIHDRVHEIIDLLYDTNGTRPEDDLNALYRVFGIVFMEVNGTERTRENLRLFQDKVSAALSEFLEEATMAKTS
jgi:hypothetical protein